MFKKMSSGDSEKLARNLIMEWHGVSSNCIDYKLKTSRVSRHNQDIFGVFDAILNDKNNTTLGYQFKYWKKDVNNSELSKWAHKVVKTNFDPHNAYLLAINYLAEKISVYKAVDCLDLQTTKKEKRLK